MWIRRGRTQIATLSVQQQNNLYEEWKGQNTVGWKPCCCSRLRVHDWDSGCRWRGPFIAWLPAGDENPGVMEGGVCKRPWKNHQWAGCFSQRLSERPNCWKNNQQLVNFLILPRKTGELERVSPTGGPIPESLTAREQRRQRKKDRCDWLSWMKTATAPLAVIWTAARSGVYKSRKGSNVKLEHLCPNKRRA